jgi:hypothetical protein
MRITKTLAGSLFVVVAVSFALAQPATEVKPPAPAGQPEMKLPPGWTEEDMKACMAAATPGQQQKLLTDGAGSWQGKVTMWMTPDSPPTESQCAVNVASIMDGRYITIDHKGEMPGMGPFHGTGTQGFDNVSQKYVGTWIDNHSTGIMNATGELASDGKTLTWTYSYTCPITKKPAVMRQIETVTSPTTKTLEMHGSDPKSGKEYKMMTIELTKKS